MEKKNLVEIINTCKSRNEILLKYFGYSTKSAYDKLNKFIIENNIDVSHLNKKIKYCLSCNRIIKTRNKFCNSSCAATFNNKKRILSDETKNKIRNSLNKRFSQRDIIKSTEIQIKTKETCVVCGNEFNLKRTKSGRMSKSKCCSYNCHLIFKRKFKPIKKKIEFCLNCNKKLSVSQMESNNIYCSNGCSNKYRYSKQEEHNKQSILMKEKAKQGLLKGWSTRNIISYPEQFFMTVLNNNNIEFKHNHPVNKRNLGLNNSCNYFLDFYIKNKNIDLEIDGKQHRSRQEHDDFRDKILIENGYVVYRIKWKNINTDNGKTYMKNEIHKFLEFYKNN